VPETPEQLWQRSRGALRTPRVEEWETWPFEGSPPPRELAKPVERDKPRMGEGGVDCWSCANQDTGLWADEHWLVRSTREPTGLPVVVFLETRAHMDFPDLDDELAAELGPMLLRVQRAVQAVPGVGNVHVCRWGDGAEHCHVWFMARPARMPQLIGSFAAVWDDILPPVPEEIWRENLEIVRRELAG
jgi:diadenosine tetraphosphate (Ap4A) HIT family hydrolase